MDSKVKKLVVAIGCLFILVGASKFKLPSVGYNQGYQPQQPIPYDHSLHAGKYQIPCMYCHTNADKSKHATIPSGNICMNCHLVVATDSPHIKRMRKYYDKGQSIPWKKVHLLPDYVHFNHQPHIQKGVKCQTCHGPIEEMAVVEQYSDLSMGWCINCHRENDAPTNCTTCHY